MNENKPAGGGVCVCVFEHERTTHTYIHTQAEVENIIKQKFWVS